MANSHRVSGPAQKRGIIDNFPFFFAAVHFFLCKQNCKKKMFYESFKVKNVPVILEMLPVLLFLRSAFNILSVRRSQYICGWNAIYMCNGGIHSLKVRKIYTRLVCTHIVCKWIEFNSINYKTPYNILCWFIHNSQWFT